MKSNNKFNSIANSKVSELNKDGISFHIYDLLWLKSEIQIQDLKINLADTIIFMNKFPVR